MKHEISDDILGYGPLEPYLRDVEIRLNGKVLLPAKVKVNVHLTSTTTKGGDI